MDYNNKQDKRIDKIEDRFNDICQYYNHQITEINKNIGKVEKDLTEIKTNVSWLIKYFWVVVVASVGALIAAFFDLLIK